jgi:hypothetical protein
MAVPEEGTIENFLQESRKLVGACLAQLGTGLADRFALYHLSTPHATFFCPQVVDFQG